MATNDRNNLNINIRITINQAVNDLKNLLKELRGLSEGLSGLNVKIVNNTKTVNDNRQSIKNNTKVVNDYTQNINSNNQSITRHSQSVLGNTLAIGGLTLAIVKVVDVLKDLAGAASSAFIEFDKELRNVNSLAQVSEERFQKLSTEVIGLTDNPKIKEGATGLTKGMLQLVSSGFELSEALEIAGVASQAATAGLTSTETAVTGLSALMNAYNEKTLQDSINYSDKLFEIVDKGVISFEQLSANLGTVAATASASKVSFDDVGAAFIQLTRAGISASESETAINNLIRSIIDPSKEASEYAKALGIDLNSAGLEALGLGGIMKQLADKTGGNAEMLAKLIPEARAFKAAATLAKDEAKGFGEALGFMASAGGSTQRAIAEQSKAIAFQIEKLKQSIENLKIEFGRLISEAFSPFMADIQEIIRYIRLMDTDTKKTIIQVGAWAVAIGSVTLAASALIFAFKPIATLIIGLTVTQIPALIAAFSSLFGALSLGVSLFGSGVLIAAIGGLGIAFGTLAGAIWTLKEAWDWWMAATKAEMQWKEIENQVKSAKEVIQDYNKVLRSKDGFSKMSVTELEKYKKAFVSAITTSTKGEADIYRREANMLQTMIESRKDLAVISKREKEEADKANRDRIKANSLNLKTEKDINKEAQDAAKKRQDAYNAEFASLEKKRELNKQSELKGNLSPEEALKKEVDLLNQEAKIYNRIANDKKIIDQSYKSDSATNAIKKQTEILKLQKDFTDKSIKEKLDLTNKAHDRASELLELELKETNYTEKRKTELQIAENQKRINSLKAISGLKGIDPETTKKINEDIFKLEQENEKKKVDLKVSTAKKEKQLQADTNKFFEETYKDLLNQDQQRLFQEQNMIDIKYRNNLMSFSDYIDQVEVLANLEMGIQEEIAESELYTLEERERARYNYQRIALETNEKIRVETIKQFDTIIGSIASLSESENKVSSFVGNVAKETQSAFSQVNNLVRSLQGAIAGDTGSLVNLIVVGFDSAVKAIDSVGKAFARIGNDAIKTGEDVLEMNQDLLKGVPIIGDSLAKLSRMWSDLIGVTIPDSVKTAIDSFNKAIDDLVAGSRKAIEQTKTDIANIDEEIANLAKKTNEKSFELEMKALEAYYDDKLESYRQHLKDQGKLTKQEIEDRLKSEKSALESIKRSRKELLEGRKEDQNQAQKDFKAFQEALTKTKGGLGQDFFRSNALDVEENTGSLTAKDLEIERQFKKGEISVSAYRTAKAEQSLLRYAYLENQLNNTVDPKLRLDAQKELDDLMTDYFELYRDSDLEALDRQQEKTEKQIEGLQEVYDIESRNEAELQSQKETNIDLLKQKYMTSAGEYKNYFIQSTSDWVSYAKNNISGITSGLKSELGSINSQFERMKSEASSQLAALENKQNFLQAGINANVQGTAITKDPFSMSSYSNTSNSSVNNYTNSPTINVSNPTKGSFDIVLDAAKKLASDFNRIVAR